MSLGDLNRIISISPFKPEDQEPVKALILAGLVEHWGVLDPTLNQDLNDIAASYQEGIFLVARDQDRVVGTGALRPRSKFLGEIVRMSVAASMRRQGVGRQILDYLCGYAIEAGYQCLVLETTRTWQSAVAFYLAYGFQPTHSENDNLYFELDLSYLM